MTQLKHSPTDIYRSFRFIVKLGDTQIGCERIWSDPFDPSSLWIVRAHTTDDQTIKGLLQTEQQRCTISMLSGRSDHCRTIHVNFESHDWLPFDLDTLISDVAREHLVLRGVVYDGPFDEEV